MVVPAAVARTVTGSATGCALTQEERVRFALRSCARKGKQGISCRCFRFWVVRAMGAGLRAGSVRIYRVDYGTAIAQHGTNSNPWRPAKRRREDRIGFFRGSLPGKRPPPRCYSFHEVLGGSDELALGSLFPGVILGRAASRAHSAGWRLLCRASALVTVRSRYATPFLARSALPVGRKAMMVAIASWSVMPWLAR